MIRESEHQTILEHDTAAWHAVHSHELTGRDLTISVDGDDILRQGHLYIDDMSAENALTDRFKVYHKGGAAVAEMRGHLPFGGVLRFRETSRYAQNHARVRIDLNWPRNLQVKRHFGLGTMVFPGTWQRMYVLPPAGHMAADVEPAWSDLPHPPVVGETMIGHWHRSPLAVVLERENGTRIEVGTGSDIWRWENGIGGGPEAGSFKLFLEKDAVRFVREPLMSCNPHTPPRRPYRFTSYIAWSAETLPDTLAANDKTGFRLRVNSDRKVELPGNGRQHESYELDFATIPWPDTAMRAASQPDYIRHKYAPCPCWHSNATRKLAKAVIRQITEQLPPARLVIGGLNPAPCWDPAHLDRNAPDGLPHWDLPDLLDFSVWARRQLGPDWDVAVNGGTFTEELPSLQGLFQTNGYAI